AGRPSDGWQAGWAPLAGADRRRGPGPQDRLASGGSPRKDCTAALACFAHITTLQQLNLSCDPAAAPGYRLVGSTQSAKAKEGDD
ncbi:MAG TPA: hypothetical protein VFQ48_03265, partial [Pseudonocardiaceae bacterium]|nr:hypothetical protein [Pseudonocardiaceae bacterium]